MCSLVALGVTSRGPLVIGDAVRRGALDRLGGGRGRRDGARAHSGAHAGAEDSPDRQPGEPAVSGNRLSHFGEARCRTPDCACAAGWGRLAPCRNSCPCRREHQRNRSGGPLGRLWSSRRPIPPRRARCRIVVDRGGSPPWRPRRFPRRWTGRFPRAYGRRGQGRSGDLKCVGSGSVTPNSRPARVVGCGARPLRKSVPVHAVITTRERKVTRTSGRLGHIECRSCPCQAEPSKTNSLARSRRLVLGSWTARGAVLRAVLVQHEGLWQSRRPAAQTGQSDLAGRSSRPTLATALRSPGRKVTTGPHPQRVRRRTLLPNRTAAEPTARDAPAMPPRMAASRVRTTDPVFASVGRAVSPALAA